MKGSWIWEEARDIWHLITGTYVGDNEVPFTLAWCGKTFPVVDSLTKPGAQINGMADALHDECFRKSEEFE